MLYATRIVFLAPARRARPVRHAVRVIARWIERMRQRRALAELDDRQLRDIAVTRTDALRECAKPFWR